MLMEGVSMDTPVLARSDGTSGVLHTREPTKGGPWGQPAPIWHSNTQYGHPQVRHSPKLTFTPKMAAHISPLSRGQISTVASETISSLE